MSRSIEVQILGDASSLERSFRSASSSAGTFERDVNKAGRGAAAASLNFHGLGRSVAFASAQFLGAAGFIEVVKSSVEQATNLEDQLRRTSAVFKTSAAGVKAWSKDSAEAMGLSQAATLEAANTIGTLLTNIGKAPKEAAGMSRQMVQLAVDMAAFKKVKPEVALQAIESALQGRTRSLRQFGVTIDAAALKEEAYRSGIVQTTVSTQKVQDAEQQRAIAQAKLADAESRYASNSTQVAAARLTLQRAEEAVTRAQAGSTGQLTAGQKALAMYNLLLAQTKDQQGAFARSGDELNIVEQKLHAQFQNIEATLGTALLPILEKYGNELDKWIEKEQKNGNLQRDLDGAVKLLSTGIHDATEVVRIAGKAFHTLSDAVGGDKDALYLLIGAWATYKATVAAVKFADTISNVAGIGGAASTSAGRVATLTANLRKLAAIGIITVEIDIIKKALDAGAMTPLSKGGDSLPVWNGKQWVDPATGTPLPSAGQKYWDGQYPKGSKRPTSISDHPTQGMPWGSNPTGDSVGTSGVAGHSGTITSGLAAVEQYAGGHVNDDFATHGHADHSYHYLGEAADLAPDPGVWARLLAHKDVFAELFGPWGLYHYGVQFYDAKLQGQHMNHIHVAYTGSATKFDAVLKTGGGGSTGGSGGGGGGGSTGGSSTGGGGLVVGHPAKKNPSILTGDSLIGQSLAGAISTYGQKAADALTPGDALHWLQYQERDLEKAKRELQAKVGQGSKKQQAAAEAELHKIANQLDAVNADIAKARKAIADERFATSVKASVSKFLASLAGDESKFEALMFRTRLDTGKALQADYDGIQKTLEDEKNRIEHAVTKLKGQMAGKDKAQRQALQQQISRIQQRLTTVNDEIRSNLDNQLAGLQQAVSAAQSAVTGAWGTYSQEIVQQFEAETQRQLAALARDPRFFQNGAQTPAEKQLAAMQAADQLSGLTDAIKQAKDQLTTDTAGGADAATLAGDQKNLDAAQRQFDEYSLSIEAQKQRTKADQDYADAVARLTAKRQTLEGELQKTLTLFGQGIANGTVSIGDLQSWLDGANPFGVDFGVNLQNMDAGSALVASDFDDLRKACSDLTDAMGALVGWVNAQTGANVHVPSATDSGVGVGTDRTGGGHRAPDIGLAGGGIVRRPTVALIGEAGSEAVIPLSRLSQAGGGDTIIVKIEKVVSLTRSPGDARDLAKAIEPHLDKIVSYRK